MAAIPRGVRVVQWKNADKSISIRYRVRVERQSFKCDEYFEDLKLAVEFLELTKTPTGQMQILNRTDPVRMRDAAIKSQVTELISSPDITLNSAIKGYIALMLKSDIDGLDDKKRRTAKVNRDRLLQCARIPVNYVPKNMPVPTGDFAQLAKFVRGAKQKPIGELLLSEINEQHVMGYIKYRLDTGIAKSTITREIGALRQVYNNLKYVDNVAFKRLNGYKPFADIKPTNLKGGKRKRRVIITPEMEDALFKELKACRNVEMSLAFGLAMTTGMRRAELLTLRWDQVDVEKALIDLDPDDTKSRTERLVILLPEAVEALKVIPRVDDRLFHYTIEGFASVWGRVVKRAGFNNVRWHDTRRSFISRVLQDITSSSVAIADMTGTKSVRGLEESTIKPLKRAMIAERGGIKTQDELMQVVGHNDVDTTKLYSNLSDTRIEQHVVDEKKMQRHVARLQKRIEKTKDSR